MKRLLPCILLLFVTVARAAEVIVDNSDPSGVTITGAWSPTTGAFGYWGANFLQNNNVGAVGESVRFTPTIPVTGDYDVYLRWTVTGARASNVPVDVFSDSGTTTYIVDEGSGGALWFKLGTAHFTAGANSTTGSVRVRTDGTNGNVVADAVRFVTAGTPSNSRIEPYTPVDTPRLLDGLGWNVSRLNEWEFEKVKLARGKEVRLVDFGWNSIEPYTVGAPLALKSTHTNALLWCQKYGLEPLIVASYGPPSAEIATLTITSAVPAGSYVIPVSGTAALPYTDVSNAAPIVVDNPAATVTGVWTTNASTGGNWGNDFLKDGNTGKGTKSVRWTPSLPTAGEYDIYIRYVSGSADNVPVDVIAAAGTETITVSQQLDFGKWVWLKRAQCNAGTVSSVLLRTTGTTQEVNADSTAWVPVWGVDAPIHACHVRKSDNSQIVPDGKWNTAGALIDAVDPTAGTITLAAKTNVALTAGTQLKVSRLKYASAATRGGTEPAWLAYRAYAKFLAEQIDAKGLKGRVELWNEPPWSADPWDHRNGFYDNPPIGTITNSPNFGMLHAVIDQPVSLPANVRYSWGGSHKSASGGVLFSSLPKPTAAQVVAVVPSEGFHPYGSTPEWHLWYPDALAAATDSTVFSTHLEGTNWQSNFKNGRRIAYQNKTNLGWTVNEQISEIGLFTSDQTAKARYSVRAFLAYMAAGPQPQMDRVNFYRLAEEPDKLAMIDINTREELPAYVAMKGLMNDIAAIGVAPGAYTTASLPAAVSPYSGYFPLMTIPVVGRSASIETKNSVLFVSYQRTYAETTALWQALAPPTVPVNISIPTGYVAQAAWDLVTRQAVPFTVAGSTVTYSVADNPVALKVTPTGGSQNVAPSAVNDSATTNESMAATIDVLANDSDADNGPQPLILASVTPPAHGTTAIVNGKILYTPNGGYFGEDSFTYTASDAALPATATVNVTVNSTATANNLTGFGLAGAAVGTGAGSSRVLADQAWEINGAGAGATGSADALWFESYATTGNFLARVRLQSLTGGAGARAGLMLREGTGAGGRFVQVGAGADATTRFTSRQPAGAAATAEQSAPAQNQYAFPDKWLLIERIGDVVTVRVDDNNSGYTEIARITLGGLSASLQLGLFTASGDAGPSARAVFSDFEFSELTTWTGLAGTQSWSNANNWSFTPPATALAPNSGDSTRVFNVAIPSGTVAADGSGYTSGDPENTGRRIGSITIGAGATVLRHTNAAVAYRDFFTGRNQSSVPSTSGVVDNRGTLRNQTAGSDWLFKWSPVTHVNAGTIEARNANAKVKFTISSATIDNTGGSITATAGGIVDFENTSSLVVQGGSLSTDAASPTKSQLQSIPTSLGSGTLASLNFLDAQIANAGTFLHDAATSQAGTRNHLTQFSGTSVFNNTGTFKVRQAMTSTDSGTQFQTSVVEFRGTAQLVNQASGSVVVTNESTSTSPGTTGLQRAVRLDFPESSTAFNNLGAVTITDTAATAGLNANAELRSTAPLTNQGQINITGLRSFLTMTGAEPYRQTAGSTVLSGATIAAANSSIEGGALKGWGTVSGNLALSGSSVFEAQLQSNGTSNLIQVIGTAEIGGTLQVTLPGGYDPAAGTEFRIMTASAGFEGAFAAVPISWQVVVRGTDLILVRENFSLWTGAFFTASELNQPSISGALANPDFDALCNLLEYALGSNPRAHDAPSHLPVADTQTGFLRMTVTRPRPAPRDLIYQPQVIGDLANGSWQGIPFDGPPVDNGNGTETLTARDTVPVTSGQPRFIRLQVQVAP